MIDRRAPLFAALALAAFGCSKPPESNATTSPSSTTATVSTTTVASDATTTTAPSSTTVAKVDPTPSTPTPPASPRTPRGKGGGECGSRTEDWCAAPAGDACGAHKDVATCRADKKCKGMKYTGESLVACKDDGTGFTSNCPTVGCISR